MNLRLYLHGLRFRSVPGGAVLIGCLISSAALVAKGPDEKPEQTNSPPDKSVSEPSAEHAARKKTAFAPKLRLKPIGDWAVDPGETQELNDIWQRRWCGSRRCGLCVGFMGTWTEYGRGNRSKTTVFQVI